MNTAIIIGLVLVLGVIFYLLVSKGNRQLKSINIAIHEEAKTKGLQITSIISPTFKEWKNAPFQRETKTGTIEKEFFKIVNYKDTQSGSEKAIWVRITKSNNGGTLNLEWKG